MEEVKQFAYIFWTSGSIEEVRRVCRYLVQERLVACANIIPWVESIYLWKGEVETAQETKVILKTRKDKYDDVYKVIKQNTQYEVPEVALVSIDGANKEYVEWLQEVVSHTEQV
ncbi:divalent-cation tolerance protein CutA [Simkania negevensis]|uniref:Divalent-cation tolerance protein CutA n=1 Tax=Simkania negevensis TaxID=83561 RepID=A0ABS3ATN3_9BACT|nr:divalent-cation tolerance protein CutA [Simkania negevensis]